MSRATFAARFVPRTVLATLVLGAVLVHASATHASGTPEQACQQGRYKAAAAYASCEQKTLGKLLGGSNSNFFQAFALSKCRVKYTAKWARLVAKWPGSTTCVGDRFVDNGDGTVTDGLTALQWEQKTDDATVHDKDNAYTWTAGFSTAANGTAFTSFLATINSGCFAGQCDWRLPTVAELQTILSEPYPCTTSPCIDQVKFGPTAANGYWSATTYASVPTYAFFVGFGNGYVDGFLKNHSAVYVRAVRGGL
jgi:hypothetical protein